METPSKEEILTEWEQPHSPILSFGKSALILFGLGAFILIAGTIAVGFYFHSVTFYLAAGVIVAALMAFFSQLRSPVQPLPVKLTNQRLIIGNNSIPLKDLSGFWLSEEKDYIIINLPHLHSSLLPVTCLYPSPEISVVREIMLDVLPEIEPGKQTVSDAISRYIKL